MCTGGSKLGHCGSFRREQGPGRRSEVRSCPRAVPCAVHLLPAREKPAKLRTRRGEARMLKLSGKIHIDSLRPSSYVQKSAAVQVLARQKRDDIATKEMKFNITRAHHSDWADRKDSSTKLAEPRGVRWVRNDPRPTYSPLCIIQFHSSTHLQCTQC